VAAKDKSRSSKSRTERSSKTRSKTSSRSGNRTKAASTPTADEADDAAPTAGANPSGTPQTQLGLAPPMTDESGSNILPGNLRQPLAEGQDPSAGASKTTSESLDPALTDPVGTAKARVQNRTSDAATRRADIDLTTVSPDLNDGPKQSDAGPEAYPFPPQGDVDVATVDPGNGKGEYFPNLEVDDWVVLDGSHDLVPDVLDGRRAVVLDAPRYLVPFNKKDDVWITCRTRDDKNATLSIPLAAVKEVQKGGLAVTHRG
jgi:hypothetical protein